MTNNSTRSNRDSREAKADEAKADETQASTLIIYFIVSLVIIYIFFIIISFILLKRGETFDISYIAVVSTVTISIILSSAIPYFISKSEIYSVEDRVRRKLLSKIENINNSFESKIEDNYEELQGTVDSMSDTISSIREQDQKSSDAHVSRIASYLLMSNQHEADSLWAVGWSARALRGYGEVIEAGDNGKNGTYLEFVSYCFANAIQSYGSYLKTLIRSGNNPLHPLCKQYGSNSRIRERSVRLLRDLYYVDRYYGNRVSQFADIPGYTDYFPHPLSYGKLRKSIKQITIICIYTLLEHYNNNGSDAAARLVEDAFGSRNINGETIRKAEVWIEEHRQGEDEESLCTYSGYIIELSELIEESISN